MYEDLEKERKIKIHFFTFKGMVELWKNAFAIVKVFPEYIEIKGYGREKSRILFFK